MRFATFCEKEGCDLVARHLVLDWLRGWLECLCDTHEAEKSINCTSTPIPFQDPPP